MVRLVRKDARAPSEELAELRMGDRIGPYLVVRLLSRGSLGDTYEVEPIDSDGRLIVKLLDPSYTSDRGFEQRLQTAIKAAASLKHPGIPSVQSHGVVDGVHYIASERIAGADLAPRGQPGRAFNLADFAEATEGVIEQRLLADILDQVLDALAAAHDRGLFHGGVKPGAVLLEERRGRVLACLSDFGLLRAAGETWLRESVERSLMTGPEAPVSSGVGPAALARIEAYSCLSPEQKEGREGSERSDVYSVGLMAFRMATGYRELGEQLPSDMAAGLHPAWDTFIRTALQRDPAQRFRSAGEMRAALHAVRQQAQSGLPVLRPKAEPQPAEAAPAPPGGGASSLWRTGALIFTGACILITIVVFIAGRGGPKAVPPPPPGPKLEVPTEPGRDARRIESRNVPVEGVITPVLPPPKAEAPPVAPAPEPAKPQPQPPLPAAEAKPAAPAPQPKPPTPGPAAVAEGKPAPAAPQAEKAPPAEPKPQTPETQAPKPPAVEAKPQPPAVQAPKPPASEQQIAAGLREAKELESQGRLAEAMSVLSRISLQEPDNARLKTALKDLSARMAEKAAEAARERARQDALLSAKSAEALGAWSTAAQAYERALALKDDAQVRAAFDAARRKAFVAQAKGVDDPAKRLILLQQAQALKETADVAALIDQTKAEKAEMDRAADTRVDFDAWMKRGVEAERDGRFDDARDAFIQAKAVASRIGEAQVQQAAIAFDRCIQTAARAAEQRRSAARSQEKPQPAATPAATPAPAPETKTPVQPAPAPRPAPEAKPAAPAPAPSAPAGWKAGPQTLQVLTPKGVEQRQITFFANNAGMKFVRLPAGQFTMGSPAAGEAPPHTVGIPAPLFMSATEVTQDQWKKIMGTEPWKASPYAGGAAEAPAMLVTFQEAVEFCRRLSQADGLSYRLPTEAEWEYACRAGSDTGWFFGAEPGAAGEAAWFRDNAERAGQDFPHPVAQTKPNVWGLYDMAGNVAEWCQSLHRPYPYQAGDGREDLTQGGLRVLRGGFWASGADALRSSARACADPSDKHFYYGFRVVCAP